MFCCFVVVVFLFLFFLLLLLLLFFHICPCFKNSYCISIFHTQLTRTKKENKFRDSDSFTTPNLFVSETGPNAIIIIIIMSLFKEDDIFCKTYKSHLWSSTKHLNI